MSEGAVKTDKPINAKKALLLLFAVNLLNFFDRQLPGVLGEPIRKEFELTDSQLGLIGTAFTLVYAAVGLPIGRLADVWVRTRLISIGVTVWSALTAISGFVTSYGGLVAARLGVGIGESTCSPACQSLIGDLFPPDKRSRALGAFMLGLPFGLCLSYLSAAWLAHEYGWRTCFVLAAVPGFIVALLVLKLPEPPRGGADPARATAAPAAGPSAAAEGSPFLRLLRIKTLWWIVISGALHNFNVYAINAFQTPFLQRYHSLNLRNAALVSALVVGLVGAVGLLAGGWASDRLSRRRADGRLLLAAGTMLASVPCVFLALAQPPGSIVPFMIPMALGTTLSFVYYATVYAAIQDVVAPRLRGSAIAVYFFAMYVMGASMGTYVTGKLSDFLARRAMAEAGAPAMTEAFRAVGLHDAMYVIPTLAFFCALVLFAASRTVGADMVVKPIPEKASA
jgi:MFS family permease